jgi:serine/threonine protein kinase
LVPAPQDARRPRRRIGKYLVTGRIGRGGMGMVYRGYDEALEREVAVKTLTVEGTLDEESRRRFEIEAKAAARLQHPNILTVFELGDERGVPFIAMELLPGVDLEALLRSGEELLLQEKLEVAIQVCRGLAYAHEHKIVHRDIKPSNVRLLDDGTVKIMDFGIAKLQGTGVTRSGMMVGTVHYMSPEQIRGQPLDGRSDVFSLGVILYEMLAGRRPFAGSGATEILYKIVHEEPDPLASPAPLPERLHEVVTRALAKDREQRYGSATQLADELAAVLADVSRAATVQFAAADVEALGLSRRLLKEGRVEESLRRLNELSHRQPGSLEARRALRAAARELQRRQRPAPAQEEDFPELDATFQSPPTQVVSPTSGYPPPPPTRIVPPAAPVAEPVVVARRSSAGVALAAGASVALAAALAAGLFLLRDRAPGAAPPAAPAEASARPATHTAAPEPVAPPVVQLAVSSGPPGAAVALDGERLPGVTPMSVEIDPSEAHRLGFTLGGYKAREVAVAAGDSGPVQVALEPSGPLGTVNVAASFPLDVVWKGQMLARGQSGARLSLPAGRHTLTLVSSAYFLKASVPVEVRGGAEASVRAPELGRISIRANPDNCRVLIDGAFVDYPPILDKPIAAGAHTVSFRWPDGHGVDESAEVAPGRIQYVMGRR